MLVGTPSAGGQGLESRYGVAGTTVWRFDETRRRSVDYDYMITTTMKPNKTVARDHCLAPARASRVALAGARYGRLFPEPPPLDLRPDQLRALGRLGGLCDASDGFDYAREVAAGWPIFGQYIAHDLTADRSALTMRADVDALMKLPQPASQPGMSLRRRTLSPTLHVKPRRRREAPAEWPRPAPQQ